ncbi:hypothetical protein K3495_g3195 [Podosphaera aphanis]|nr:hypothetical protein K3495_g3195 [Podosphaera aphanis]
MIDTGASSRSTAGYAQFLARQKITDVQLDENSKDMVNVQFGIGSTSSIGSVTVHLPIGNAEFHIVNIDTPFLLCLADIDRLHIYFNNLKNTLVTTTEEIPIIRRFGHPFLLWNTPLQTLIRDSFGQNPCHLTSTELKRLHRRFGHPSVDRLYRLLDRAGYEDNNNHRNILQHITRFCQHCQRHGGSPGRFRFTLKDNVRFNYCIVVDIMYIDGNPLLHVIDEGTKFQADRWLQNLSAKHTWDMLQTCWIDTYLGPPDIISHDAGKNFVSKEFREYAQNVVTQTKGVPVESHHSIGLVERYHGPLRRIYKIITAEIPGINKNLALQMTFKALNDTAGPDGLVPTLLVFGAYRRMTDSSVPSPTVSQRSNAIQVAMKELNRINSYRKINNALNMRNGPSTTELHDLPLNAPVVVWRESNTGQAGHWDGPFSLISISDETYTLNLPSGPTHIVTS